MNVNPELEARILEDPDDVTAHMVYGDWLSERGDPRGELVQVQAKLRDSADDEKLKKREAQLIDQNGAAWLGKLADWSKPRKAGREVITDVELEWRLGFVRGVRIGIVEGYDTSEIDFPEAIAQLMKIPHVALVRRIDIGAMAYDDYPTSWSPTVEAMKEHGTPASLRALRFDRGGYWDISSTELGDVSILYPQLEKLERLYIEMGQMELGEMKLPALASLTIRTGGLTKENVDSIVKASWPNLTRLELWTGETGNDYGCSVEMDDLKKVLSAKLPKLEHLALANSSLADELSEVIASSKILPQLRSLGLGHGTLGDEGGRALLDHAEAFEHLETLDLTCHWMSGDMMAELKEAFGDRVILDDPQGESEPDDRYCALSE